MVFRNYRRLSAKAVWSRKVTFMCLLLLIMTVLLHRFASLHTPAALVLMGVVTLGALISVIIAVWALIQIWNKGFRGAGRALISILMAMIILTGPALSLPKFITLPVINDITTDFNAPPNYEKLAQKRSIWANSIIYPGRDFANKQKQAYPHIQPMILERSVKEAYDLVRDAVKSLEWKVIEGQPPGKSGATGWIEATDKTLIMGYTDDIVVRVSGDDEGARIDVRSSSRFGRHDFGSNAQRIDNLFAEVRAGLTKGEQQLKIQTELAAQRALKRQKEEQQRREKAALARKEKEEERARQRARQAESVKQRQRIKRARERRRRKKLRDEEWNRIFDTNR